MREEKEAITKGIISCGTPQDIIHYTIAQFAFSHRLKFACLIVSEVNIQLIKPCDGLVGFASVVLDGQIYLSSIGIHQRLDGAGYRITYPTKKTGNRSFDVFHPIKKEIGQKIEEAVLSKIAEVMNKVHVSQHRKGGTDADK